MSGARGGQSFGIRLSLDGADAVEGGLRRLQQTAGQMGSAIAQTGENTSRALSLIDRGSQAASQGLTKLGGDFAAIAPLVDNVGGAVGRLVAGLSTGPGLLGVLGLLGGAVTAVVAVYQNWDVVTRAVSAATDTLTGRVRAVRSELSATYALLNQIQGLAPQAQSAAAQGVISQIDDQAGPIRARIAENERRLAAAQAGGPAAAVIRRGGASGLVPTDDFAQGLDRQLIERQQQQQAERAAEIERNLSADRAALRDLEAQRRRQQGVVAAAEENVGTVTRPPPAEDPARPAARGGGGGGGGRRTDPLEALAGRRDAFLATNDPLERYAQTLSRIGQLQADLAAAGQSPLPDEAVLRATNAAMEEYERAVRGADRSTRDLADGTKDLERAGQAAAKALAGAFEELVFEGKSFDDVLKNLERSLLRVGNQYLLNPLFQRGFDALLGEGGGQGGGSGGAGAGGGIGSLFGSLLGSFGGAAGGAKGAVDALAASGTLVSVFHAGGIVGGAGVPMRAVAPGLFAGAPRFHSGGLIGPDEVPIVAQRGERVLSREQNAAFERGMGGVTVNINGLRDVQGFNQSRGQVGADIARAVARAGRNR